MILTEEQTRAYLGKSLEDIFPKVKPEIRARLIEADRAIRSERNISLPDYLLQEHQLEKRSLRDISRELNMDHLMVGKLFRYLGFPTLTREESMRRLFEDPEYRAKVTEVLEERWRDPEFRRKHVERMKRLWQTTDLREKQLEAMTELWQNPQFRAMMTETSRDRWQDPQYRARMINMLTERWKDNPEYRKRMIGLLEERWRDPEYRARMLEVIVKRWEDPKEKRRISELSKKRWRDPEYRARIVKTIRERADTLSEALQERWRDPEYRARTIEAIKRKWKDPKYKAFMMEINSKSRRRYWDRAQFGDSRKEALPTNHGFRKDIGYNAKSSWEANLARVLLYCGREFETDFPVSLTIPDELRDIFNDDNVILFADFLSITRDNRIRAYEIMAHPLENAAAYAKISLFQEQYPYMRMTIVDRRFYKRLERDFKDKINTDQRFVGWEDSKHNIRTHPEDFT